MRKVKSLGQVVARGFWVIIVFPICFFILKSFLSAGWVMSQMALLDPFMVFIIQVLFPVGYIVGALLYTFMPIISPEEDEPSGGIGGYGGYSMPSQPKQPKAPRIVKL